MVYDQSIPFFHLAINKKPLYTKSIDSVYKGLLMLKIVGKTETGAKFRPSAWAEMLVEGVGLTSFGTDHKIHYVNGVDIGYSEADATTFIVLDESIKTNHKEAYDYILNFAGANGLQIFF